MYIHIGFNTLLQLYIEQWPIELNFSFRISLFILLQSYFR